MIETWRQDLMQRPWRGATNWLVSHGFLFLKESSSVRHQTTGPVGAPLSWVGPFRINHWCTAQADELL